MRDDSTGKPQRQVDEAMNEALDDTPRAADLVRMRAVLLERRNALQEELEQEGISEKRHKLQRRLIELDEQIGILTEEASINQFVEETVQLSREMHRMQN